jgi:hypothetical protein
MSLLKVLKLGECPCYSGACAGGLCLDAGNSGHVVRASREQCDHIVVEARHSELDKVRLERDLRELVLKRERPTAHGSVGLRSGCGQITVMLSTSRGSDPGRMWLRVRCAASGAASEDLCEVGLGGRRGRKVLDFGLVLRRHVAPPCLRMTGRYRCVPNVACARFGARCISHSPLCQCCRSLQRVQGQRWRAHNLSITAAGGYPSLTNGRSGIACAHCLPRVRMRRGTGSV